MPRKILVLNGHPDPAPSRLAHALASAYERGAQRAGHHVRRLDLGAQAFPLVVTGNELEAPAPEPIRQAQEAITWADHVVIVFPLWLSAPPALLKGFFEQICRYGYAFDQQTHKPLLKGRSARLIVTMIIPTLVFHLLFSAGVRGFARGVLFTSGFRPIRKTLLGNLFAADHTRWLAKVEALGEQGR